MKKFLAILLAAMLLLSVGAVAVAEETAPTSEATSFTFKKYYNNTTDTLVPGETLKFNVAAKSSYTNPDQTMISIADHKVTENGNDITVTVPAYSTVGTWKYTVTEQDVGTQGVTYYNNSFDVSVTVVYDDNGGLKVASKVITSVDSSGNKITSITNQYAVGDLTIDKNVTGNLASTSQKFDINVTFTSDKPVLSNITGAETITPSQWTVKDNKYTYSTKVSLAHGDPVATFSNIPAGVSYVVEEDSKHFADDPNGSNSETGYTAAYSNGSGSIVSGTTAVTVTNTKNNGTIETGITTDSLPYVMLLGFVLLAGAALIIKRRVAHN